MDSQGDPTDANRNALDATFAGITGRALYNMFYAVLAAAGAFVMAYPLENVLPDAMAWYPSLFGVSLMAFAATALLFNNTRGTVREKVEKLRMELGSLVIASFFLLGVTFAWETESLEGVGIMGILILLGTIIGGNLLSHDRGLSGGEVRTAIAVSVVAVFFGIIAVQKGDTFTSADNWILAETFEHFWKVLIAVIGFYFGGLTLESLTARAKQGAADPADAEPAAKSP